VSLAEISGSGIRLRAYRPDDAEAVAAGYDDPLSHRFLPPLPSPFTLAHAERFLSEGIASIFAEGGAAYAIADPETDDLLGGIGFDKVVPSRGQAEIGYWVGPWARGRGVATAAVRALSGHALSSGLDRLELLTHWENVVSQRVALAAGYQREGVRRAALPDRSGGRDDLVVFARLATDDGEPAPRLLPDLPGGDLTDGVVRLRPLGPDDVAFETTLRCTPDVWATSVPPEPPSPDQVRRHPRRPGDPGRGDRRAGRRHRALLRRAAHRPGDDRLQHAAGVPRARLHHPGGPAGGAVGVRRDGHRPPHRGRVAVEHRLAPGAGEGGIPPGGVPEIASARAERHPNRRRAVRPPRRGPPDGRPSACRLGGARPGARPR
jgi:RimJ/RimL family protein N-acetyltransferase